MGSRSSGAKFDDLGSIELQVSTIRLALFTRVCSFIS